MRKLLFLCVLFTLSFFLSAPKAPASYCPVPQKPFCLEALYSASSRDEINSCAFELQLFESDVTSYGICPEADQNVLEELRQFLYEAQIKIDCHKNSKIC